MATQDKCCTIVPYFKVQDGKLNDFKAKCEQFVEKTMSEEKCLYYGFSFAGEIAHCREGYEDAEGLLAHLENVGTLLEEALKISEIIRFEIHGPKEELNKLREPLSNLNPQFFQLEYGFRR
jgi:quinol monooxygenase YgiN